MSIRFAPANVPGRAPACSPIAKGLVRRAIERVANDNGYDAQAKEEHDKVLRAALRHFAEHGMSAARTARAQAENALMAQDYQSFDWWLGITRTLDRRLADEIMRTRGHLLPPVSA